MKTKFFSLICIFGFASHTASASGFEPLLGFGFNYMRQPSEQVNKLNNMKVWQAGFLLTSKRDDVNFTYDISYNSRKYNYTWPGLGEYKKSETSLCHLFNFKCRISAAPNRFLFFQTGVGLLQYNYNTSSENPALQPFVKSSTNSSLIPKYSFGLGYNIKLGENHLLLIANSLASSKKGQRPALTNFLGAQFAISLGKAK